MYELVLTCHLKNETNELYEMTTVCVVLANCPIVLLTVQTLDPFRMFWTVSVYLYIW